LKRAALFAAVALLTRLPSPWIEIFDVDETAHAVGSWVLMDGGRLYEGFVDNKPPLLYASYALAQLLFGRGLFAVHLFTAVLVVPLVALAASACHGHGRRGLLAGLLFLVYSAAFLGHDMLAAHAEILLLAPAAWAVALLLRDDAAPRRFLASGALLSLAFLIKYPILAWLPVLAFLAVRRRGRALPSLLALGAGVAAPIVCVLAWLAARGELRAFLYWTLESNVVYLRNPIPGREVLGRAAASLLPFAAVTAPLLLGTWRSYRTGMSPRAPLVTGLLLLSLASALPGLRFYPHYLIPLYFPLAVGAAPFVESLLWPRRTRGGVAVAAWSGMVLVGFTVSTAVLYREGSQVYGETRPVFERVARRLRGDACFEGASLFVWGYAPPFYYRARLPPASRFVVMAPARLTRYVAGSLESVRGWAIGGEIVPRHWDWLMADLERSRATYIVDAAPTGLWHWDHFPLGDQPRLQAYVADRYDRLDTVDAAVIYRRRGCEMPSVPGRTSPGSRVPGPTGSPPPSDHGR
jgi:hypothetical protein